jgi:hypothetical protein
MPQLIQARIRLLSDALKVAFCGMMPYWMSNEMLEESLCTALSVENSLPWWWQLSQLFAKKACA